MKCIVTYEAIAFLDPSSPIAQDGFEVGEIELEAYSQTRRDEGTFPAGIEAVSKASVAIDDGQDGEDEVKSFVSIDLVMEAEGLDAAEKIDPDVNLLTQIVDALYDGIVLDNPREGWECLMAMEPDEPAPAV